MCQLQVVFLLMCAVVRTLGRATDTHNLGVSGGHKIKITDAPYMAGLIDDLGQMCGGSIVHERFILTSAYCVQDLYPVMKVHIGSKHVDKFGIFIEIEKELCHENYNLITFDNDICLLKLKEPVQFSESAAVVQLPAEYLVLAAGTLVNVTGWGNKGDKYQHYPKFLQQATLQVVAERACHQNNPVMSDNMFCAGVEGRDACDRDNGGPLTHNNVQVGIVSSGTTTCGLRPSYYTKVAKYVSWINNTIRNNL